MHHNLFSCSRRGCNLKGERRDNPTHADASMKMAAFGYDGLPFSTQAMDVQFLHRGVVHDGTIDPGTSG